MTNFSAHERYLDDLQIGDIFAGDGYVAPIYEDTAVVRRMHNFPRFGNGNELDVFVNGQTEEQKSYIVGLIAIAIFILSIFLVWSIVIMILKCCGRRVGCASGMPPKKPGFEKVGVEMDIEEYNKAVKRAERTLLVARIVFLLCGVGVLLFCVIFILRGLGSLKNSLGEAQSGLDKSTNLVEQILNTTNAFLSGYSDVKDEADTIEVSLNDFCPNQDIDMGDIPMLDQVENLKPNLKSFDDPLYREITNINGDLEETLILLDDFKRSVDSVSWAYYAAVITAGVQAGLALILMIGVIAAWCKDLPKPFLRVQSYFVLPIFWLFSFLSCLFAMVFVIGAVAGSDFCVGNVNDSVIAIVNMQKKKFNSLLYQMIIYYVTGCQTLPDFLAVDLPAYADQIGLGITSIHDFLEAIPNVDTVQMQQICGTDLSSLATIANVLHGGLHVLLEAIGNTRKLLLCSSINPIYVSFVYDAVCLNGVDGLTAIYGSQLAIALLTMVMITLRVSWYQVEREQTHDLHLQPAVQDKDYYEPNGKAQDYSGPGINETHIDDMPPSAPERPIFYDVEPKIY